MMNASKATSAALSRAMPRRSLHATRVAAAGKDVYFGTEGRAMMLAGVEKLADAVQVKRKTFLRGRRTFSEFVNLG